MTGGGDTQGPYDQLASLYLPVAAAVFALVAVALVVVALVFFFGFADRVFRSLSIPYELPAPPTVVEPDALATSAERG